VQDEVEATLFGYVAGRTLELASVAPNGAGRAARAVEWQALYWRPVAIQGEVEEARTCDEKLVALIRTLRPCCSDEHEGLGTDVAARDTPWARPPRETRGAGPRGARPREGARGPRS
jgi:hypothetical protein